MKGMIYLSLIMNKAYIIAAAIVFAASSVLNIILVKLAGSNLVIEAILSGVIIIVPIIGIVALFEGLGRNAEKYIKCRFFNVMLSGMTPIRYATVNMVEHLIYLAAGLVFIFGTLGITALTGFVINEFQIKSLVAVTVLFSLVDRIVMTLTLKIGSAEKAGLIVGLIVGFGLVLPIMLLNDTISEAGIALDFQEIITNNFVFFCFLGAAAVIYALDYYIEYRIVKRGDIC